ncbi:MAG: 3-hydroxyacyl-CoA dehydrogenase NAD-binding domain-containing protein [Flavobacteriales bacterium]|nr:3-hydroxyacyl-CoA dehydrogenase NAD-binding domain-containing protein [Flavobacteriales bacterium]
MKFKRSLKKVAIIGSGIMGSRIACHMANIGLDVLLLDIAPSELNEVEKKAGLPLNDPKVKDRIVNEALKSTLKSKPAPLYKKEFASRIETGNLSDGIKKISNADWIIEVVVERLDIKKQVYDEVEKYRKKGSIVSSNTSGIPIHLMLKDRSDDFKKHFLGTHFFNPPRYLELLEIIPTKHTDANIVEFLMDFGDRHLGKTTVLCKDTPAFIANRIGVAGILSLFHLVKNKGLTVEAIDKLTGPIIGRPKSATFRTCDVVGLDTLVHVAHGLYENCPKDLAREEFKLPKYVQKLYENKWLGDKTKQGFYKKTKNEEGKKIILSLDFKTFEYKPQNRIKFPALAKAKEIESLRQRIKFLFNSKCEVGDFYREMFTSMFAYVSHRIPEISDETYRIDQAIKAGFGWELGPFEIWDAIGIQSAHDQAAALGRDIAPWVKKMLEDGQTSFYRIEESSQLYYNQLEQGYLKIPSQDSLIELHVRKKNNLIWQKEVASLIDLGDGIVNLEFHSKMNSVGGDTLQAIQQAIELTEEKYRGLIIANQGANFSVGANLAMIFMMAIEQDYEELDFAVRAFQQTTQKIRYSNIPVVVAPHAMTLGGGCEISLHADLTQAAAETYMGLVEMGVGLIPGGGGSKEMALRASERFNPGDIENPLIRELFLNIGMAKVSSSAHEAMNLGLLRKGVDGISINKKRRISDAKAAAIALAEKGYRPPSKEKNVKVLGNQILGSFLVGADSMLHAGFITEHEKLMSEKLGYVMAGGDLSKPTLVSEQYLLDLEREAFLSLTGERKTLERIEHMLKTGKPLRN